MPKLIRERTVRANPIIQRILFCRAISAPLNPGYTIEEFRFYLQDTKPALLLIPPLKGNKAAQAALEAAQKESVPVYEMWLDGSVIRTGFVFGDKRTDRQTVEQVGDPLPEDVALVLHTSGTTGRCFSEFFLSQNRQ